MQLQISRSYVQSFIYVPSLSSPLLLRISPHTFAFIQILPMCLSSRNRSNSKAFRHILPCVAPVCEGMHYHKTGVPWQMKSIFIFLFISSFSFLHCFGIPEYYNILLFLGFQTLSRLHYKFIKSRLYQKNSVFILY